MFAIFARVTNHTLYLLYKHKQICYYHFEMGPKIF